MQPRPGPTRLMRHHRIRALAGRRCRPCTSRQPSPSGRGAEPAGASRLVASAPDRVRLADITTIATGEGWLHLSAVLDLATRTIVGWAMRDHMRTEAALSAPMMAFLAPAARPGTDPPLRQGKPIRSGKPIPSNSARSAPCRP